MAIATHSKYIIIGAGIHGLITAWHPSKELRQKRSSARKGCQTCRVPVVWSVRHTAHLWSEPSHARALSVQDPIRRLHSTSSRLLDYPFDHARYHSLAQISALVDSCYEK